MQLSAPLSPLSLRSFPLDVLQETFRRFEITGHPDAEACWNELERREKLRLARVRDDLAREAIEMRTAMIRTLRQVTA